MNFFFHHQSFSFYTHKVFYFVLPALFFLQLSCMKTPEFEDSDGSPASATTVRSKMIETWGDSDPFNIQNQEFHLQEKTVQVSSLPPQRIYQRGITVTQVDVLGRDGEGHPTVKQFHLGIQADEMQDNNQSKVSSRERVFTLKSNEQTDSNVSSKSLATFFITSHKEISEFKTAQSIKPASDENELSATTFEVYFGISSICGAKDFNCFNLKTWVSREPAPKLIADKPGCEGLSECKITYKYIQFDVLYTQKDEEKQTTTKSKVIYTIKVSQDAPFLSHMMSFCYMGLATANNQKFPVKICYDTVNFNRGNP